jgi:hypothetical protein
MHPLRRIASITSLALVIGATLVACAAPDIPIRTGPAALGSWDTIDIPEDVQINAIHSVALPTGDVLLIAGSGNDVKQFAAGTFETLLYSPATGQTELIDTPEDLFCNGHAHLPNGNILVAGGTQAYETAPEQLTNAGGVLTLVNETPQKEFFVAKGTQVVGDDLTVNLFPVDLVVNFGRRILTSNPLLRIIRNQVKKSLIPMNSGSVLYVSAWKVSTQ